jgi:hypothetical protein
MGASGPHFSDSELQCRGTNCSADRLHGCGVNGCQQSLVEALERFRELAGKPVLVNDAYRCKIHNAEVGGVGKSEHMEGLAADIRVEGLTAGELERIALKIHEIRGIGRADHKKYLHIDVRPTPTLAHWCYGFHGEVVPYYTTPESVGPINA